MEIKINEVYLVEVVGDIKCGKLKEGYYEMKVRKDFKYTDDLVGVFYTPRTYLTEKVAHHFIDDIKITDNYNVDTGTVILKQLV